MLYSVQHRRVIILETPISGARGHHGGKGVTPCGEHGRGVAAHEWLGYVMKIPEHLVTVLVSNEADCVGADVNQK